MSSLGVALNWLIVLLGFMAVWYQWRAYRILRSPAFIIMFAALVYLTVYRALLPYYPSIDGFGVAAPFYFLMVAHGIVMTRSLSRVLELAQTETTEDVETLEQADRPLWRPRLDYIALGLIVTAIVVVLVLEVLEVWGVLFWRGV